MARNLRILDIHWVRMHLAPLEVQDEKNTCKKTAACEESFAVGSIFALQGTKISHLKRKVIFKNALVRDMLVPGSVTRTS